MIFLVGGDVVPAGVEWIRGGQLQVDRGADRRTHAVQVPPGSLRRRNPPRLHHPGQRGLLHRAQGRSRDAARFVFWRGFVWRETVDRDQWGPRPKEKYASRIDRMGAPKESRPPSNAREKKKKRTLHSWGPLFLLFLRAPESAAFVMKSQARILRSGRHIWSEISKDKAHGPTVYVLGANMVASVKAVVVGSIVPVVVVLSIGGAGRARRSGTTGATFCSSVSPSSSRSCRSRSRS